MLTHLCDVVFLNVGVLVGPRANSQERIPETSLVQKDFIKTQGQDLWAERAAALCLLPPAALGL